MAYNDAELRFRASLDDDVSVKADRLERKLQQMGKSPAEIKMILRAVDEATPKIKEVQSHVDKMPREHMIHIRANHMEAMREMDNFRRKQETPVKMRFEGIDNALEKMKEMFNLRTKISGPLGAVPGVGQLYGLGAGAGIAGVASAGIGGVAQGVAVQSRMEQSLITLDQTLKDQGRARDEMRKLVDFAIKTPFQYQDVLAADVRLRSYQIPTMPGDPGAKQSPNDQGWLKSAGDMAAAMQTPITQAVEAIADARQGYFVRMMTYGIRMMREDFEKGGKYAGLSYEQGIERALKRFDGAMMAQSKSFQGVMSNLKDVLQNKVLAGVGQVPFEMLRERANNLQTTLQSPEAQEKIARATEKFNVVFLKTIQLIRQGREYFEMNLQKPLEKIAEIAVHVGAAFAKAFGGTLGFVIKTLGETFLSVAEAVAKLADKFPVLFQFFGVMKALSLLGFSNMTRPFDQLRAGLNPLSFSLRNIFGGIAGIPKSATMVAVALMVKGFLDAHQATKTLNSEFKDLGNSRTFDKVNADISKMAMGLGKSSTEMKKLVTLAGSELNIGDDKRRLDAAKRVAEFGVAADKQFGIPSKDAIRMLTEEANREGKYKPEALERFYTALGGAKGAADALGIKFKDLATAVGVFQGATGPVGLGGQPGAPMLGALLSGASKINMTDKQSRLYGSPSALTRAILEEGGSPSNDTLRRVLKGGQLQDIFDFRTGGTALRNARDVTEGIDSTYRGNLRQDRATRALIDRVAPMARLAPTPMAYTKEDFNTQLPGMGRLRESPGAAAEMLLRAALKQEDQMTAGTEKINKITDAINKLSNASRSYQVALEDINRQMAMWQQNNLVPIQRHIEDLSLSVQEYTLNSLRPLERQMNRLAMAGNQLGNTMSNAQYDMQQYSQGLLSGEQATLDNLHALERYNKQLQLLQLIHQTMGAELGRSTFRRGFSSRVEPLFGLSLQMQMERAQRRQQRQQLEYELGYGEKHYELGQAGRSKFERQEMSFQERLGGIQNAVGTIDRMAEAQHRLSNQQFELQERIFMVSEHIADQTDEIQRWQLRLGRLQASGGFRALQDAQFDLQMNAQKAAKQLERQNTALARQNEVIQDYKIKMKAYKDAFLDALDWGDIPEKNAKKLIKLAEAANIITKGQAGKFLKEIQTAQEGAKEGRAKSADWDKKDWISIIRTAIFGIFTGDFWRKLGDQVKGVTGIPGSSAVVGVGGHLFTLAIGTAVAGVLAGQAGRAIFDHALVRSGTLRTWAGRGAQFLDRGRGLRGVGGLAGRGSDALGRLWLGRQFSQAGFGGRMLEAARPLLALRRAAVGFGVGTLLTPFLGPMSPLATAALGGVADRRLFGNRLFGATRTGGRLAGRGLAWATGLTKASDSFNDGVKLWGRQLTMHDRRQSRAIGRSLRASQAQAKSVDNAKKILTDHEKALGRNATRTGAVARRLGRFGRIFAGAVTAFVAVKDGFSTVIDKVKNLLGIGDDTDDALRGAGAAGQRLKGRRLLRATRKLTETMPEHLDWDEVAKEAERGQSSWQRYLSNHPGVKKWLSRLGHGVNAAFVGTLINDIMQGDQTSQIASGAGAVLGGKAAVDAFVKRKAAQGVGKAAITRAVATRFGSKFIPFVGQALLVNDALDLAGELTGGDLTDAPLQRLTNDQRQNLRSLSPGRRDRMLDYFQDRGVKTVVEAQAQKFLERLERAQEGHSKKLLDNTELYEKVRKRRADENNEKAERGEDKHGEATLDIMKKRGDQQFRTHDKGMKNIHGSTKGWLDKVKHLVKGIDKDFGLTGNPGRADTADGSPGNAGGGHPSSGSPDVLAHGGFVPGGLRIGKGKLVRVGEEGHEEAVIPLAPHRRHRAMSLVKQVQGRLGNYANGGILEGMPGHDMAYLSARGAYSKAVQGFANGGLTGPYGSGAAFTPIANFAMKKFGLTMTAGRTNHNVNTTSGNVSDHSWGGAGDFSNGTLTPQEDAFSAFWKTKGRAMVKQLIWRNQDQFTGASISDHLDHVHLALQRQYAFDEERMAKILSNLSEGLSIKALLAGAGTGDVGQLRLPGVPKKLKDMGPIGRKMMQVLKRKRRQWQRSGAGGGDFSNIKGSGAALMKAISRREGWDFSDWWEVDRRETGHGTNLLNESSGAALRGQFMPGITQGHYGPGSDPGAHPSMRQQIISMARYIKSRYPGGPTEALAHHNKFNWYKTGAYNIGEDNQHAVLHRGEMVLPERMADKLRAAGGNITESGRQQDRAVRLTELIEDIRAHIRKAERHLKDISDKTDKRNQREELAALNDRLRSRMVGRARAGARADRALRREITMMGDRSGGENTLALVMRERAIFQRTMRAPRAALRRARQRFDRVADRTHRTPRQRRQLLRAGRVRQRIRQLRRRARSRQSPGGRRVTRGERTRINRLRRRARTLDRRGLRGVKSPQMRRRLRGASDRVARAQEGVRRARRNYIVGAARRGVNARLIRDITGKGLNKEQQRAYKMLANAVAKHGSNSPQARARTRQLINALRGEGNKSRSHASKRAARNVKEHAKNRASASKHAGHAARARANLHHRMGDEGNKSRAHRALTAAAGRAGHDKRHSARRSEDDKRDDKREQREERREKKMVRLLEQIAAKDLMVNIHNEAHGATLTTTRTGGRRRAR